MSHAIRHVPDLRAPSTVRIYLAEAAAELLRLLLDHDRLAVAGALASRQMTTTEIADYTGRGQRIVLTAIGDLRAAGLVMVDGDRYGIDVAALRDAARSAAELDVPMDPIIGYGMTEDEQVILRRFFSGRTLTEIPTSRNGRHTSQTKG